MMKISSFDGVKKFKFQPDDEDSNAARFRELDWLADYLSDDGYNLEFGVFSGSTINCIATARPDLDFHGFDSFEGLPEDWDMGAKQVSKDAFDRKGELPEVSDNVRLWKGWFEDTITEWKRSVSPTGYLKPEKHISFLHVDCDIYKSTVTVLEELNDSIVPGTIIRFDELSCWRTVFNEASPQGKAYRVPYTTWKEHEWKALNEWLEKNDRVVVPICRNWFQSGTVVVTK